MCRLRHKRASLLALLLQIRLVRCLENHETWRHDTSIVPRHERGHPVRPDDHRRYERGRRDPRSAGDQRAGDLVLDGAERGPAGHPRLGARLRRETSCAPPPSEWDEREETPWPIIQEAAKIGLYGFESLAQFWADPTGLTLPIVNEELFWGDAGIGMAIMGTTLAVAGIFAIGTPRADGRVGAAVLRHRRRSEGRRLLRLRARRRLRRLRPAHAREVRRGEGRVGPQRPEGVGHERRHRQRPRRRRLGRPGARLARPGGVRDPAGHARASRWARRSRSTACAPRTRPTCSSTTAASPAPACSAARRSSTSASRAPARARASRKQAAMATFEASPPDRRRAGARHRPRRLRVRARLREGARPVRQARSSRTRRSRSRSPT